MPFSFQMRCAVTHFTILCAPLDVSLTLKLSASGLQHARFRLPTVNAQFWLHPATLDMEMRITALAAAALLLSTAVTAHEHHNDKIEEGHAISADPIVCNDRVGG